MFGLIHLFNHVKISWHVSPLKITTINLSVVFNGCETSVVTLTLINCKCLKTKRTRPKSEQQNIRKNFVIYIRHTVRSEVTTATIMVFYLLSAPCTFVGRYQRFRETCCLRLRVCPEDCWHLPMCLLGTTEKNNIRSHGSFRTVKSTELR